MMDIATILAERRQFLGRQALDLQAAIAEIDFLLSHMAPGGEPAKPPRAMPPREVQVLSFLEERASMRFTIGELVDAMRLSDSTMSKGLASSRLSTLKAGGHVIHENGTWRAANGSGAGDAA